MPLDNSRLVAFEGLDGAGKTEQARRLSESLTGLGQDVELLREPGGTQLGEKLREILLVAEDPDPLLEALLFSASRRCLVVEKVLPALRAGKFVILDRSFLSTWVYQGLAGGLALDFLDSMTRKVMAEAWPDRILLLDVPPELAEQRRKPREVPDSFERRGSGFLEQVAKGFRELARKLPDLVRVVDAGAPLDTVERQCFAAVEDLLGTS